MIQMVHFILIYPVHLKVIWAVHLKCCNQITARAAIGSVNYQGDLSYIKDNEPKYLDFEKFKAMDEFLKTSENS